MALTQPTTLADWAPQVRVSLVTRLLSYVRSAWVNLVHDNLIAWKLGLRGRANAFEDMEGPFFLIGAPSRQVADGQAVLASPEVLNQYEPFLLVLTFKDTRGDPMPHATIDAWHANSAGSYYFASWTLRGTAAADAQGRLELLTARPGDYAGRSAHVHMRVEGAPAEGKGRGRGGHAPLTTQAYVLRGNDPRYLGRDVLGRFFRSRQDGLVVTCYDAASEGQGARGAEKEGQGDGNPKSYRDLPELPQEETDLRDAVGRWDAMLKGHGVSKPIMSVGRHEIRLTAL